MDLPYYRFKKNLTKRKFTGTHTQNMGTGASCLFIPSQMKKLSIAICMKKFITWLNAKPAPRLALALTRKV